jgi:hypothetical protein
MILELYPIDKFLNSYKIKALFYFEQGFFDGQLLQYVRN